MKYNFSINQAAAVELGDVDIVDCAIIEWLRDICVSQSPRIKEQRTKGYTWVSYQYAIDDMPLLGLNSKPAFRKRLQAIINKGYFTARAANQRVYVKPTPKMDRLFYMPVDNQGTVNPSLRHRKPQFTAADTPQQGSTVNPSLLTHNPITKTLANKPKKVAAQPPASDATIERVRQQLAAKGVVRPQARLDIVRHNKVKALRGERPNVPTLADKPVKSPGNGQKRGIERQATITQLAGSLIT
jgi:hypothetical protein